MVLASQSESLPASVCQVCAWLGQDATADRKLAEAEVLSFLALRLVCLAFHSRAACGAIERGARPYARAPLLGDAIDASRDRSAVHFTRVDAGADARAS